MEATEAAEAPEASRSHRSHQEPPGATRSQDRRSHRSHEANRSQDQKKSKKKMPKKIPLLCMSLSATLDVAAMESAASHKQVKQVKADISAYLRTKSTPNTERSSETSFDL